MKLKEMLKKLGISRWTTDRIPNPTIYKRQKATGLSSEEMVPERLVKENHKTFRNDLRKEVFAIAKKQLDAGENVLLELATGVGKSKMGLDLSESIGAKNVVVLVPTDAVGEAWVGEVGKWNSKLNVVTINYVSAHKVFGLLFTPDIVIMDEGHHITERNLESISQYPCPLICLSATVDWEKMNLLKKLGFKRGIKVSLDEAIENDLVAPYEMNVISFPVNIKDLTMRAGNKTKAWLVTEKVALNYAETKIRNALATRNEKSIQFAYMNRMRMIRSLPSRIELAKRMVARLRRNFPDAQILVFTSDIAQCEAIVPDCFYHSKCGSEGFEAFKQGKERVLGSVGMLDEGVNVVADICVIVAGMSKARRTVQRMGRILRKTSDGKFGKAFLLVAEGTQDEKWEEESLAELNNVKYYTSEQLKL